MGVAKKQHLCMFTIPDLAIMLHVHLVCFLGLKGLALSLPFARTEVVYEVQG